MNIVTKIGKETLRMSSQYECSECDVQFTYGPGFPEYCPECGELFDKTEDKTAK